MVAASTHVAIEAGHTWTGGRTTRHRVDYILMDRSLFVNGGHLTKDHIMHGKLRHSVGKLDGDHIPIRWTFKPQPWYTPPITLEGCDYRKMTRSSQTRDEKMKQYVDQVDKDFKSIWMRHQPQLYDPMGYTGY